LRFQAKLKGLKMSIENNNWEALTLKFDESYHDALQQQHHAAQFIALVGRHLIEQQPDDSNTNLQYLPEKEMLVGNKLSNGSRLGLEMTELEISLLDKDYREINKISLADKTRPQVFEELKRALSESGIDVSKLSDELHYEIPVHPVGSGATFETKDNKYFKENTLCFRNSDIVLNAVISEYENAASVRVWPHHFDAGTLIPLSHNSDGSISRSIGLGWAIPDSMVEEPYFYLSFWSENSDENINDLQPLDSGKWLTPGWSGAVLRHSEILQNNSAEAQNEIVEGFFISGIEILTNHYK